MEITKHSPLAPFLPVVGEDGKYIPAVVSIHTDNKQYLTFDSKGGFYKNLVIHLSDLTDMYPDEIKILYDHKEDHGIEIVEV